MSNRDKTRLDHAIDATFDAYNPESDDALKQIEALEKLHKLKPETGLKRVNLDTAMIVAGNLVGILLIVGHEHTGVMASKAMSLVGLKHR